VSGVQWLCNGRQPLLFARALTGRQPTWGHLDGGFDVASCESFAHLCCVTRCKDRM